MPETDLRARSAADYLRMLQHLLPQGQAWTRAPGAVLTAVLQASADELERLDMAMRLLLMGDPAHKRHRRAGGLGARPWPA